LPEPQPAPPAGGHTNGAAKLQRRGKMHQKPWQTSGAQPNTGQRPRAQQGGGDFQHRLNGPGRPGHRAAPRNAKSSKEQARRRSQGVPMRSTAPGGRIARPGSDLSQLSKSVDSGRARRRGGAKSVPPAPAMGEPDLSDTQISWGQFGLGQPRESDEAAAAEDSMRSALGLPEDGKMLSRPASAGSVGAELTAWTRPANEVLRSFTVSLCATAHPLHTRTAKVFGASFSEATMRPNPRPAPRRTGGPSRSGAGPRARPRRRSGWQGRPTSRGQSCHRLCWGRTASRPSAGGARRRPSGAR
jgi:hypothetical protein